MQCGMDCPSCHCRHSNIWGGGGGDTSSSAFSAVSVGVVILGEIFAYVTVFLVQP